MRMHTLIRSDTFDR
ncbi:protein of unknown function [Ralstonia solanacearum PSI07]|nr:protein of unknown function [Ralstonia solanacearum PSI07]